MPSKRCLPLDLPGEWDGWRIDQHGVLWAPDTWRQGFTPHQLRAMFFECQQIRSYKNDIRQLRIDLAQQQDIIEDWKKRATFYRRQCTLEAQIGMALQALHKT